MNKETKKSLTDAADAGGPPPELTDIMEQSGGPDELTDGGDTAAAAIDGGSVPASLVAEIEDSLPDESAERNSPNGAIPGDSGGALDAGQCPEDLIIGVAQLYDADDDDENPGAADE